MIYFVVPIDKLSWGIYKCEEDEECPTEIYLADYVVNFNIFLNKFVCNCKWNTQTDRPCIHINMTKQYILKGVNKFEK